MGRLCAAIAVSGWLIGWAAGSARADAPVKIASVPDGPIKLGVGEGDVRLRRSFRLVPQAVEHVKLDQVRVLDCTDARGQSCTAWVEPGGCAGGCTLTAVDPGSVTIVVIVPAPGTYTASLEIVYVVDDKPAADGKVSEVKAVLATPLEVTRPAPAVQPMKLTVTGATGAEVDLGLPGPGGATLQLRIQDDDGAARTLGQVAAAPLVRKSGNDALATGAAVVAFARTTGSRIALVDARSIELPATGATLEVEVSGLDEPGRYEGKLRLLAPGRTPQDVTYSVTVRDGAGRASLLIALGAIVSYAVQWWIGKRRSRLVQQSALERLRDRLQDVQARGGLADRDRRLLDALLRELDDLLYQLEDGDALAADTVARFARRAELAELLIKAGQDVERLPLAARAEPRRQLDGHALALAVRTADDSKLKEIEAALNALAGASVRRGALADLLVALDAAVEHARDALSPALRARLTAEVDPALRDAHTAAGRDQLDELDGKLAAARRALAEVEGAALAEMLPAEPPEIFDDAARYQALRDDVIAKLAALAAATDADAAVRLYDDALACVASAMAAATARWSRAQAQVEGMPPEIQAKLRAMAGEADAARSRPPAEMLAIAERVRREAREIAAQPEGVPTSAGTGATQGDGALAAIPWLAAIVGDRRRRTRRLIALGDGVVLVSVTLIAVATGLKLLWVGSPTWGGWNDALTAILWGAGLHAIGNDSFKGLLGLKKDLGKLA
jgi:hypothetical protein